MICWNRQKKNMPPTSGSIFCDREFTECRIRICERIQALEKISTRPSSEKSRHSRNLSVRSSRSSSSHRISLALVDAAAKAAKLRAEMEVFDKEREIRRL